MYIQKRGSATPKQKAALLDSGVTMKQIEEIVAFETASKISGWEAYALSKAALNAYTIILARQHPKLAINSCTPGFILTNMTKSMGARSSTNWCQFLIWHA